MNNGIQDIIYPLNLPSGYEKQLIPTGESLAWVKQLAYILGLSVNKKNHPLDFPKVFFVRSSNLNFNEIFSDNPFLLDKLPKTGWYEKKIGSLKFWYHYELPDIICDIGPVDNDVSEFIKMVYSVYPIYQNVIMDGGMPFHSALIERDGHGVLLAASGNTGKSTCCRRIPSPWRSLCDDESLIMRTGDRCYEAHPFPTWSDYLTRRSEGCWDVQQHVPIDAIFFLEQGNKDEVTPIMQGNATMLIYQSAIQACNRYLPWTDNEQKAIKKQLFDNACELSKIIPSYTLRVSLTGRFWDEIEKVLPDVKESK